MNGLDENMKQYRRDMLTHGFRNGLEPMIRKGLNDHGPEIVVVVACTQTTPGRNFLQWIGVEGFLPEPSLREIREGLASEDGAVTAIFPFRSFSLVADTLMESLADHLRGVLARPGAVPVVVLGGGGTMVAVSAYVEEKGVVPQALLPEWKTRRRASVGRGAAEGVSHHPRTITKRPIEHDGTA